MSPRGRSDDSARPSTRSGRAWGPPIGFEPDPRWEVFAAREPHFAVLTAPRFLRANLTPADEREFFDSGEALVDWMFRTIELRLAPHFSPTAILEYGCGIGRLAIPCARRAGRRTGTVTAVDRSRSMLEAARHEAERRGVTNITFRAPDAFFAERRTFDFINCYLVFQRLARRDGLALLRALISRLAAGGVGVFQFPYRTTTPLHVDASRWLREHVPPVNGLANILRGKPAGAPFIASHAYDLADVFTVLDDASVAATHVAFQNHNGLASAIVFVEAASIAAAVDGGEAAQPDDASGPDVSHPDRVVDVRQLIASTSVDDLNRSADDYFASLTDWEHHLAKPFSDAGETPQLLISVATLLQGLRVTPGTTVLEFGAGTGWLSRILTQLGCRVILLDVSTTALQMARETYARQPVTGDRLAPQFLLFDGRHIDLSDESVDRIVCLDAFHHAPDPAAVIREFGRVLRPGGIAGFAEPGPHHSRGARSQFEMRTYGVVENDIDVHAIWHAAEACGFTDMKLMVFHGPPFPVSREEFEDFLAGGSTCARWVSSTRGFLRNMRSFFLFKESVARDSRAVSGLGCEIHATLAGVPAVEGEPLHIDAMVTNSGAVVWLPSDAPTGGVRIGAHLYDAAGKRLAFGVCYEHLSDPPREIAPGETVRCRVTVPPQRTGRYLIELDCVASRVTWFAQIGSRPATVPVDVVSRVPSE